MQQPTRKEQRDATRDISYSSSAQTRAGRFVIRATENLTGRPKLIRRAKGYQDDVAKGAPFFDVMADRYGIRLDIRGGSLDNIPRTGPLIVVSNHPYGILDGLTLGHILTQTRGDFRIIAHRVFRRAEELNRVILPISFDETKAAQRTNIETRKTALCYLAQGGTIGIFPGGTVSTSAKAFSRPYDPVWRNFTARLIAKSGATILPIYFDGANSRLFQVASRLHNTLRMALLISEFRKGIKTPVPLVVGEPMDGAAFAAQHGTATEMMAALRAHTYGLSTDPSVDACLGFEFEARYR